jgi:hypothetical protein
MKLALDIKSHFYSYKKREETKEGQKERRKEG